MMEDRLKIFGMFGLLGFMAGIIARATYTDFIPWIMLHFPTIGLDWVLSGFAGAVLTVGLVMAWAYITSAGSAEK
jgi:hypothetical protein